jgi:hypothetical protein
MQKRAASPEQLRQRLELRRCNAAQPHGRATSKVRRARDKRAWKKEAA